MNGIFSVCGTLLCGRRPLYPDNPVDPVLVLFLNWNPFRSLNYFFFKKLEPNYCALKRTSYLMGHHETKRKTSCEALEPGLSDLPGGNSMTANRFFILNSAGAGINKA